MRYQGGKGRLAKLLAQEIRSAMERVGVSEIEDRFCGGLAVSVACHAVGLRVRAIEDGNPALINCYRAVAEGWEPPSRLSPEDYQAIKQRADPADPMTAFALGFCSYSGKWAAGRHPDDMRPRYDNCETGRYAAAKARKDLLAARPMLTECEIREGDCLGPCPGALLYADIPYEGTAGYAGAPPWDRAEGLARLEVRAVEGPVLVSECQMPAPWREVWAWTNPRRQLRAKGVVERLYTCGVLG